jgi:hypothetical protein
MVNKRSERPRVNFQFGHVRDAGRDLIFVRDGLNKEHANEAAKTTLMTRFSFNDMRGQLAFLIFSARGVLVCPRPNEPHDLG